MKEYIPVFVTVFLAELGDKTQLATLLFAAEGRLSALGVFLASAGALVVCAGLGVLAGSVASQSLQALPLKLIAGMGFVAIGLWTIHSHFAGG